MGRVLTPIVMRIHVPGAMGTHDDLCHGTLDSMRLTNVYIVKLMSVDTCTLRPR